MSYRRRDRKPRPLLLAALDTSSPADMASGVSNRLETLAGVTADERQAAEWDLVLSAAGIEHRLLVDGDDWALLVAERDAARAAVALDAYVQENRPAKRTATPALEYGHTYAGLLMALGLLAFHAFTSVHDPGRQWYWRGNASAQRILDGEVWRTITALTLHADAAHVTSNALFCALFGTALCRAVGPGVGLWLMLLAGAAGNACNTLWRGAPHNAIGASTAVFGTLGVLGGLQFMNRYRFITSRRRAWIPLAAALGLLAMLGTGADTDILAHLFGLIAGTGLGIATAVSLRSPPGRWAQAALTASAATLVVFAWWLALR